MPYDNTNTGIISKNNKKNDDNNHPELTGRLDVEGVEYFIDAWYREKKDGTGWFYSLRVKRLGRQAIRGEVRKREEPKQVELDDEVPF